MPRRRVAANSSLNGPDAGTPRRPPPDLGLSPHKAAELETRIRGLLRRWQPMANTPEGLARDVYELVEWVLDGDEPAVPHRLTIEGEAPASSLPAPAAG